MEIFKEKQPAYIVENGRYIRRCEIIAGTQGMYTIRFDSGAGIRLRGSRLFKSREEAVRAAGVHSGAVCEVPGAGHEPAGTGGPVKKERTPWDYMR